MRAFMTGLAGTRLKFRQRVIARSIRSTTSGEWLVALKALNSNMLAIYRILRIGIMIKFNKALPGDFVMACLTLGQHPQLGRNLATKSMVVLMTARTLRTKSSKIKIF